MKLDPLKRLQRSSLYRKIYVSNLLKKIQKNEGIIYIAKIEEVNIDMIAGIIEIQKEVDKVGNIESNGRVYRTSSK